MRQRFRSLMFLVAVLLLSLCVRARDSAATLSVRGDVQKPLQWTMEALKAQFAGQVQSVKFATGKNKQLQVGTGIPLLSIIRAAALKTDKRIKHQDSKFLVILEAKDSYRAFFSLAELTPPPGDSALAFLIWDLDGKPLSGKEAPLRLVLLRGGGAREIYGVTKIILVDGMKLADQLEKK